VIVAKESFIVAMRKTLMAKGEGIAIEIVMLFSEKISLSRKNGSLQ
jgi:hypothetical protein